MWAASVSGTGQPGGLWRDIPGRRGLNGERAHGTTGQAPRQRRYATSETALRLTSRRCLPGCDERRSRREKGRRRRWRRLQACRCVRMDTRCPAVYRRAGRRQRSWLSAKHDSRQDARCLIPLSFHCSRQKKKKNNRNSHNSRHKSQKSRQSSKRNQHHRHIPAIQHSNKTHNTDIRGSGGTSVQPPLRHRRRVLRRTDRHAQE